MRRLAASLVTFITLKTRSNYPRAPRKPTRWLGVADPKNLCYVLTDQAEFRRLKESTLYRSASAGSILDINCLV